MLEKLKVNTLIRELEFLKSDLNYKTGLLTSIDVDFNRSVDIFLENYPDLGNIYKQIIPLTEEVHINQDISDPDEGELQNDTETTYTEIGQKAKSLYRQIAKTTHPDKVGESGLKEVYFEAQKAYEGGKTLELMSICDRLKIPYEISDEEIENIRSEIQFLKERISFLESTFTFKWMQTSEGKERDKLILNYIGKKLNI